MARILTTSERLTRWEGGRNERVHSVSPLPIIFRFPSEERPRRRQGRARRMACSQVTQKGSCTPSVWRRGLPALF